MCHCWICHLSLCTKHTSNCNHRLALLCALMQALLCSLEHP